MSKTKVLKLLFDRIKTFDSRKPILIGIDGIDGSGKSIFSERLVEYLRDKKLNVFHSSVDYFHNPRAIRHNPNKPSFKSYFEDSFNYFALKKELLDPLKNSSRSYCFTKYFNHQSDLRVTIDPVEITPDSILVFDGIFNHRDELKDYWDFSVFLDVEFQEAHKRMAGRDDCPLNPENKLNERYYLGQKHYLIQCDPKSRATMVIDNNNYRSPKILNIQRGT